jgi:hypothetical protein
MDKKELLEKIYDKYQMEIARKDRLESKTIGYYTIIGIFFAAFLVVEPILFEKGLIIKFSPKDILSIINYLLIIIYLISFIFSIFVLHQNYKPKIRNEFDPVSNWDLLVNNDKDNEEAEIEGIKTNLVEIIQSQNDVNMKMAVQLNLVNKLCIINALIIVLVFVVLLTTYII